MRTANQMSLDMLEARIIGSWIVFYDEYAGNYVTVQIDGVSIRDGSIACSFLHDGAVHVDRHSFGPFYVTQERALIAVSSREAWNKERENAEEIPY